MHLRASPSPYFRVDLPPNSWEAAERDREGRRTRERGGAPWVPEPTLCPSSRWAIVGSEPVPKDSRDGTNRSPLAADALLTPRSEGGPCHEAQSGGSSGSLNRSIAPIFIDVTQLFLLPSSSPNSCSCFTVWPAWEPRAQLASNFSPRSKDQVYPIN